MNLFVFDIETGPLPEAELIAKLEPKFEADSRLKDPEKIAASIAEKKQIWLDESALHAERGQLLAWGEIESGGDFIPHYQDRDTTEKDLLVEMVELIQRYARNTSAYVIAGFNILGFDLPFIRRRCLIHGIRVPWYKYDKWKPWKFDTFDAMQDWQSGNYKDSISLDRISRALGIGKKTGNGADFAKLFATDKHDALKYLANDVQLTYQVCERMMQ